MGGSNETPTFFADAAAFRDWLVQHAATAPELLVGYHKVDSGRPSMRWSESVDEALCFGWIDGVRKRIDEHAYQIRFTPRRPTSIWSAVNIAKIEALRAAGRMTAAGEAAFALRSAARSEVYAYEQAQGGAFNDDERRALDRAPAARDYFDACPPGYRRQMLHWLCGAKKPQTRASRFETLLHACSERRRLR